MYFLALAADYDGTIANHGFVDESTAGALRQLKETGRRLVLVTGRELADLRHTFAEITIFDRVVAENGAVKDYSSWFRHVINDGDLASEVTKIEADLCLGSQESRKRVRQAVCRRYAVPEGAT